MKSWGSRWGSRWVRSTRPRDTPSRRAARRNVACFSWSTSPRTSRAREGQWVRATPAITPQKPRPQARETRIMRRMWGIPSTRSMIQETRASTRGPQTAEAVPSSRAIPPLRTAVRAPTRMLSDSPATVRASMSRPIQSVPKGWARQGGRFFRVKSASSAGLDRASPAKAITNSNIQAEINKKRVPTRRFVLIFGPPPFGYGGRSPRKAGRRPGCRRRRWQP